MLQHYDQGIQVHRHSKSPAINTESGHDIVWENARLTEVTNFDYDEIDRRLAARVETEGSFAVMADALRAVATWVSEPDSARNWKLRATVFFYFLRPRAFRGIRSGAMLARELRCTRAAVAKNLKTIALILGNHSQFHGAMNQPGRSAIALAAHKRLGHKIRGGKSRLIAPRVAAEMKIKPKL